ncbi:hypothetical protein BDW69DRAFT_51649 [Aspergillus filifer]
MAFPRTPFRYKYLCWRVIGASSLGLRDNFDLDKYCVLNGCCSLIPLFGAASMQAVSRMVIPKPYGIAANFDYRVTSPDQVWVISLPLPLTLRDICTNTASIASTVARGILNPDLPTAQLLTRKAGFPDQKHYSVVKMYYSQTLQKADHAIATTCGQSHLHHGCHARWIAGAGPRSACLTRLETLQSWARVCDHGVNIARPGVMRCVCMKPCWILHARCKV